MSHSYCEHGGVCILPDGHEGKHSSGYCTWDDNEALPQDEADKLFEKAISKYSKEILMGLL